MRILVISPSYPPSPAGEAEHCHQIASRLAAEGHRVDVLTGTHPMPAAPSGFALHAQMRGWRWRDALTLRAQLIRLQPDAVLVLYTAWLFDDHPMVCFLATWLRRVRPGVRVLTLVEVSYPAPPGSWPVRLGRKLATLWAGGQGLDFSFGSLLRDSHAVAVLGPSVLDDLARHCPGLTQRTLVIPPPPLVRLPGDRSEPVRQRARARLGAAQDTLLLAYFGYVYKAKGVETLLAALQRLRAQGRDVRLVMAGGGRGLPGGVDEAHLAFESRMRALALQLGVAEAVAWPPGQASESDAMGLDLLAADIAVLPFDDGAELRRSSIAVVASLGLPLITTQPSGPEAAFAHDSNCYLCPPRNAAALAEAVLAVADDTARRMRLREGAMGLARDWFSWSAATAQLLGALRPAP